MIVAQTNLQLLNRLNSLGYSHQDLGDLRSAYDLARELFSGLYRPSGKTFLAHLIGTASILAESGAGLYLVKAGLMHAAYEAGDFGDGKKGVSDFKRNQIRTAIGDDAERLVYAYDQFQWPPKNIQELQHLSSSKDQLNRGVAFMRLANELEEFTDLGFSYCHDSAKKRIGFDLSVQDVLTKAAEELGHQRLSDALKKVFSAATKEEVPESVRSKDASGRTIMILPRTYQNILEAVASRMRS